MKFKVGDRVKFLNQNGGGIVVKILSPQMLSIAIEDGFEIPTLASEVLKIENDKGASSLFRDDTMFSNIENLSIQQNEEEVEDIESERIFPLKKAYNASQTLEGIYLAFIPHDQRWMLTGPIDIYLINYTCYELIFSLFLRDIETGNFIGKDYDAIPKHSKILLSTIERDEIVLWSKGTIQALFHTDNDKKILNPLNTEFKIKEMRFLKEESYKTISILDEKALLVNLANISDVFTFIENKSEVPIGKDDEKIIHNKGKFVSDDFLELQNINIKTTEIDLHIQSLVENSELLNPSEILSIQLNHFEKSLNAAIENKLEQITFIHGVGSGKLKTEITGILERYEGLHWFDAPMSKYGTGATKVLIGQHAKRSD